MNTSKSARSALFTLITGLLLAGHTAQATVIFEDDFSDGNRNGWFSFTSSGGTATVASQQLVLTPGTGSISAITYFTPTTLAVGETMTLTFEMSFSAFNNDSDQFRYGLFNSNGTQISSDLTTTVSDAAFNNDTGFAAFTDTRNNGVNGSVSLRERDIANNTFWSTSAFTSRATSTSDLDGQINVARTFRLELDYTAVNSMTISSSIVGVAGSERSYTTATPFTTVDSLSIFQGNNQATLTFDNFEVSVIPEPSTAAFGMAAMALVAAFLRRRR